MQLFKLLYIFYIPLLLIEWLVDLIAKIWNAFHESIKEMTLVIETKINEPNRKKPSSTNKG